MCILKILIISISLFSLSIFSIHFASAQEFRGMHFTPIHFDNNLNANGPSSGMPDVFGDLVQSNLSDQNSHLDAQIAKLWVAIARSGYLLKASINAILNQGRNQPNLPGDARTGIASFFVSQK